MGTRSLDAVGSPGGARGKATCQCTGRSEMQNQSLGRSMPWGRARQPAPACSPGEIPAGHGNPLQHSRLERSQQGTATRSSTLAWRDPSRARQPAPAFSPGEIPRTEEPSGLQPMGSQRIGHNRSNSAGTQACSGVGTGGCARCERTLRGKESAKASQVAPGVKNLLRPPKGRQG